MHSLLCSEPGAVEDAAGEQQLFALLVHHRDQVVADADAQLKLTAGGAVQEAPKCRAGLFVRRAVEEGRTETGLGQRGKINKSWVQTIKGRYQKWREIGL